MVQRVYIKPVDNKTDTPEFDMKVSIPEDTKLSKVNIYLIWIMMIQAIRTDHPTLIMMNTL